MITIRPIRKKLGITQKELAAELGVTPNAISNWENGVRNPSLEKVKRLAEILNCTTDELLKGEQK